MKPGSWLVQAAVQFRVDVAQRSQCLGERLRLAADAYLSLAPNAKVALPIARRRNYLTKDALIALAP